MMNVYEYADPYSGPVLSLDNWKWLFLRPFFMFNGKLFLDSLDENSGVGDNKFYTNYLWSTLLVMFFGNALILNLLIALFGTIYSEVSNQTPARKTPPFLPKINMFKNLAELFTSPHAHTKHAHIAKF